MPRVKPRKTANYSSAPRVPVKRYERKGHLVQEGKPKGKLKALLETPLEADSEPELEALAKERAASDAFLRAMTEGEE